MMNVKIEDMTEAYRVGFDHGEEKARQFRRMSAPEEEVEIEFEPWQIVGIRKGRRKES